MKKRLLENKWVLTILLTLRYYNVILRPMPDDRKGHQIIVNLGNGSGFSIVRWTHVKHPSIHTYGADENRWEMAKTVYNADGSWRLDHRYDVYGYCTLPQVLLTIKNSL